MTADVLQGFVEIERTSWLTILYNDGRMSRVFNNTTLIAARSKVRTSGYCPDRICCPAVESTRVKELLQQIECVKKEDLE
ncbi:MAG: hypothetical protein DRP02_08825 [Candidatus Gerdarchaeota archaeon]|nr:MAG: hypothetical protein DRP02_08825 [Candidatus Gerdarchaeota archaeon]